MHKKTCGKCRTKSEDVVMRQCDYHLCNKCEAKRIEEIREIEQLRNATDHADPSTGLQRYVAALKAPPKLATSTPNEDLILTESAFDAANSEHPCQSKGNDQKKLTAKKCSGQSCLVKTGDSTCSCFICQKDFHLSCMNLSRRPPKTSNWCCSICSDFPAVIRKLYASIDTLTAAQNSMQKEQIKMIRSHDALLKENAVLRSELEILKCIRSSETDAVTTQNQTQSDPVGDVDPVGSLILGDSMLRDFDNNTFDNAQVKAISGATVSDIFKELNGRGDDLKLYKNIIIHAGTNDISKNIPLNESIASMEAIVTLLMIKAPTAKIHISAVCPRIKDQVQHKVETLNEAFKELATRLDVAIIDVGPLMTYRNGAVDKSQLVDGLHLSSRGCDTLSETFADSVAGLVKSQGVWQNVSNKKKSRFSVKRNPQATDGHSQSRRSRDRPETLARASERNRRKINYISDSFNSRHRKRHYHDYGRQHVIRQTDYHHQDSRVDSQYRGCYNCGLMNHNKSTCYHKERLRCNNCDRFGHKANYCDQSNHGNRFGHRV